MISNRDLKGDLTELNHRLDMIQTVLLVSNPDSSLAAEAYEGLRRTVLQSLSATRALQAAIAQLDMIAATSDDVEVIRVKLNEFMTQYGLTRLDQYEARPDAFDRIGPGPSYVATKPAYVTSPETPPILMGVAEGTADPATAPHPNTDPITPVAAKVPDVSVPGDPDPRTTMNGEAE